MKLNDTLGVIDSKFKFMMNAGLSFPWKWYWGCHSLTFQESEPVQGESGQQDSLKIIQNVDL